MVVYNRQYFDNFYLVKKAKEWLKSDFINNSEYNRIIKQHPSPYKSFNIFARIGLFLATLSILGSAAGMFNLFLAEFRMYDYITFQCFFFGSIAYILAEVSVRNFNLFQVGVKEALLYAGVCTFCFGIIGLITGNTLDFDGDPIYYFICIFPFITIAAIRFSDTLLSLSAFFCLYLIDALAVLKMGIVGKMILPFESMGFSYLLFYLAGRLKMKEEFRYSKNCIILIETVSLITLYLSGNYMVVRKLTESLLSTVINPGEDIHIAFFFYAYTILIPLVYVWIGLKKKNYTFLRTGLLLEVGGILAIKYYHTIMPPETAMTVGGIAVILIAYFSIKYLKTPKHSITYELNKHSSRDEALANIGSILASKVLADMPTKPNPDGIKFGGGDAGGGGASADY